MALWVGLMLCVPLAIVTVVREAVSEPSAIKGPLTGFLSPNFKLL